MIELYIENDGVTYQPLLKNDITWATERKGVPGKLTFTVMKDAIIDFQEGNNVILKVDNVKIFNGFVFKKKRDKEHNIAVTAYDQTRYLKNKDTYNYENKTASDVIKMIADDFQLEVGEIEPTSYIIPSRVEDNSTLFDMIQTALDLELKNKSAMYVLYDDFGKLTLKSLESMRLDLLIDDETAQNFEYESSIDDNTYNKIKLIREDKETKKRELYITQDGSNINRWGILQMTDRVQDGENGEIKADALLSLYNAKTRTLKITGVFGDTRVRAGSMIPVFLNIGDLITKNYLIAEKCTHKFENESHTMDLTMRGGEFVG